MNQILDQLKQSHKDLDLMIQELHTKLYPDEYIKPYKQRKLTIKDKIESLEKK